MTSQALAATLAPGRERSLAHGFSWILAGRFGVLFGQWGMLVLLARFGSAEVLGLYGLGLALCAPVFAAFDARLPSVAATGREGDADPAVYFRLRLLAGSAAIVVCIALGLAGYGYGSVVSATVALIALAKGAESVSTLLHGLQQRDERMATVGQSLLLANLLMVLLGGLAMIATGSLAAALVGVLMARMIALFAFDLPRAAHLPGRLGVPVTSAAVSALAWTVAPLSVVMLLKSASSALPRLILESHAGRTELGYFTAIAAFLVATTAFSTALCQAAGPRLARSLAGGRRPFLMRLAALLALSLLIGTAGVLVAALLGAPLLRLVYGPEYAGLAMFLVWMLVAGVALHVRGLLGTALTALRALRSQALVSATTLLTAAVVAFATIPSSGLAGAVAATVAASVVSVLTAAAVLAMSLRTDPGGAS